VTAIWIALGAALGLAAGWWLGRRPVQRRGPATQLAAEGPPLLEWILRANAARGAWLLGPGTQEAAVAAPGVGEDLDQAVRARLEHQRAGDGQGVERLEGGSLVYASLEGRAAGLLLDPGTSAEARAAASRDLARLLDYDRWRPVLAEVSRQQDKAGESVESVALRLAHQLERMQGVEVCVAVPHPTGVRVAGVSLRSDRRLLGSLLEPGSILDRVALGRADALAAVPNPLGKTTPDRRRGADPAFVCPIQGERAPVGAVALWTAGGREPIGPGLADFRRAIEAAGPRLQDALERRNLAESALRDPLTGLLNRLGLQEAVGLVSTTSAALVYLDLDHFKALNDELGHPAGDSALTHVARLLLQAVRAQDAVARIGGEEFAIWLPGAPLERAREVAERFRQALAWSDWRWQGQRRELHASFGVSAWPETSPTRDGLPGQADAALYEAKRAGRDRVALAPRSQTQLEEGE
jgi:diguanylate cyclase (GGDEF)-like protein